MWHSKLLAVRRFLTLHFLLCSSKELIVAEKASTSAITNSCFLIRSYMEEHIEEGSIFKFPYQRVSPLVRNLCDSKFLTKRDHRTAIDTVIA